MDETIFVVRQSEFKIPVWLFVCLFLLFSAYISYAAYVVDVDLVLLTLAKRELCSELINDIYWKTTTSVCVPCRNINDSVSKCHICY